MRRFNPNKVDFLLIALAYIGSVIYFRTHDTGLLLSLFFGIPSTILLLIWIPILTGIISGLVKPFIRWLKR